MAVKCFICKASSDKVSQLLDHLEDKHGDQIPEDMSVGKFYYAHTHGGITTGECQICKSITEFDEKTGRTFPLCKDPKCKEESRKRFQENMKKKYGKEHVCDEPMHQIEMIKGRKNYDYYTFADGGKVGYMCKLELEFLRFCDIVLEFKSNEVEAMGVVIKYHDENGRERFTILDFYLNMYSLVIEIKEGGDNPNTHPNYIANTKNKEKYKDIALVQQKEYNVVKIYNNDFRSLVKVLFQIKNDMLKNKKPTKQFIEIEDKLANSFYMEASIPIDYRDLYLIEFREPITNSLITFGITDTVSLKSIYLPVQDIGFINTSVAIKPLKGSAIFINKFTGDKEKLTEVLKTFNGEQIKFTTENSYDKELLNVLADLGVNVFIDHYLFNNEDGLHDFARVMEISSFESMKQLQAAIFPEKGFKIS